MALFGFFKRKQSSEIVKKKDDLSATSQAFLRLHDDLKGLVLIGDGPYKNYEADKTDNVFVVDGIKITISIIPQGEPSIIFTKQKVEIPKDENSIERPPYYPTYTELTPEQKWIYLKLLSNPYDSSINIGYVFILYYGLERHLLCGDFENAFYVILKLRNIHSNKSFQSYSANALILTCMLHQRADLALEFVRSLDKEHKLAFSDNLFLIFSGFNSPPLAAN